MEETGGGALVADSLTAEVLAAVRAIEADAEAIVSQARKEAEEHVAHAARDAEARRRGAAELDAREAELRVQTALATAEREVAKLREAARERMRAQRDSLTATLDAAADGVVAMVLPKKQD